MQAKPYQIEGADFLLSAVTEVGPDAPPRSRLLLSHPGLGKTVQGALALAGCGDRIAVVVCPAGMRRGWVRHLSEWCPRRGVRVAETEAQARQIAERLYAEHRVCGDEPVLVLSHDNLAAATAGRDSPVLRLLACRAVLLIDEVHFAKSATSRRGRAVQKAVYAVHDGGGAVMALSATPMPRDPIDLWVVLTWIGLAEWCFPRPDGGADLHAFAVGHFGGTVVMGRWRFPPTPPGGPLTGRFARVALRHLRDDALPELPEKAHEVRTVPVEGAAASMLDRVARAAASAAGVDLGDLGRDDLPGQARVALEIGRRLEDLTELRVEMARAKIPAMLAWVDELERAGTPCAVYSDHLAPIEALGHVTPGPPLGDGHWHPREGWVVIRGETSERPRDTAVQAFESGEDTDGCPIWGIAFTGAGRVGISLNRAEVLIVVSRSWAHASEEQAEDRVLRFGKLTAPTIGYLLLGHPLELFLHKVLAAKRTRSEIALSGCVRPASAVSLPSVIVDVSPAEAPRDRRPWMSHKRLTTWRDCGFSYDARYRLRVGPPQPPESRRLGILFAGAIAGRLVVWARDPVAAAGPEGDAAAAAEVKREAQQNEWAQKQGRTEEDGRTAIELSRRTMERFGFFSGRWTSYMLDGRPAVEIELRAPMVPAHLPFADPETRRRAEESVSGWAGFYGRCDLIAYDKQHRGGTGQPRLCVVDFKCKERMSEGLSDGADDLQLMLYLNAARALGIPAELATRIEVRNKLPEEPKIVRGNKLSTAQANITDVVLFEQAIKRHGFKREDYAEHLDWLAREGPRCYQPVDCGRVQSALDQVWREMCIDAMLMLTPRPVRNLRNFLSSPCHSQLYGCEHKELCTATMTGSPTPDGYARDLVQLGRLKPTTWRAPKIEDVGVTASDTQAPQEF